MARYNPGEHWYTLQVASAQRSICRVESDEDCGRTMTRPRGGQSPLRTPEARSRFGAGSRAVPPATPFVIARALHGNELGRTTMNIVIAYDGSDFAKAGIDDLRRAGLPQKANSLVVCVGETLPRRRRHR